jgi:hypothetical protein
MDYKGIQFRPFFGKKGWLQHLSTSTSRLYQYCFVFQHVFLLEYCTLLRGEIFSWAEYRKAIPMSVQNGNLEDHSSTLLPHNPPSTPLDAPFTYNPQLPIASDLTDSTFDSLFASDLQPTSPVFSPSGFDFETLPASPDFNILPTKEFKYPVSGDQTLLSSPHLSPSTSIPTSSRERAENSLFETVTSYVPTDNSQFQDLPAISPLSTDFFPNSTSEQDHLPEPDLHLTLNIEQQALNSLFDSIAQGHTLNHSGFTPSPARHQVYPTSFKNTNIRRDIFPNLVSAASHLTPFEGMDTSNSPTPLNDSAATHPGASNNTTHQPHNHQMGPSNENEGSTNPFLSSLPTIDGTTSSPPPPSNPATTFPTPLPPPNIPLRLPPLLDSPILPGSDLILANRPEDDEARNNEAYRMLMSHKKDRTPYVLNASERLQAVLNLRNELPFELPTTPSQKRSPLAPALKGLGIEGLGLGLDVPRGVKRDHHGTPTLTPTPTGMNAAVTEQGLREFLLQRGKEGGMKKVQCSSVTFHDFTPDLRTHAHQNRVLGHCGAERGCRVDYYEVDL